MSSASDDALSFHAATARITSSTLTMPSAFSDVIAAMFSPIEPGISASTSAADIAQFPFAHCDLYIVAMSTSLDLAQSA